jgi:hypothetical protein
LAVSLSTFLFLGLAARESWRVAFGLTLGTYRFFVISIDIFKLAEPDPGLLAEWLGVRDSNRSSSTC